MNRLVAAVLLDWLLAALASGSDADARAALALAAAARQREAVGCVCGDSCTCEKDTCPKKCPVAVTTHKPPAGYPPAPAGFHWAVYPGGVWGLVQDGVTVPVQAAPAAVPQTFAPFQPFPVMMGGCPNGQCPRR